MHDLANYICYNQLPPQAGSIEKTIAAIARGTPNLPEWARTLPFTYPSDRLLHSHQIDLRELRLAGERVLVVGSGLTSGHLALGAIARGAIAIVMARRTFYEKLFDAEPGWLGPKYLKGFHAEPNWETRWRMIQSARNGGSLPPAVFTKLRRLERAGKLSFYERCEVRSTEWKGDAWKVTCNRSDARDRILHQPIDRIWLATGSVLDVNHWSLLSDIRAAYPLPVVKGLPVLNTHLRWAGCDLFVMGGAAALQLGPVARNLFGAKKASERIVPALLKKCLGRRINVSLSRHLYFVRFASRVWFGQNVRLQYKDNPLVFHEIC